MFSARGFPVKNKLASGMCSANGSQQIRYLSSSSANKKVSLRLPRVRDTNNISRRIVHLEGLFAGYKPLFLGNSSPETTIELQDMDDFLHSNTFIASNNTANDFLTNVNRPVIISADFDESGSKEKLIPWDASVGGMIYNDHPFKNVPRSIVRKLKVFKKPPDERPQLTGRGKKDVKQRVAEKLRNRYINFKVHNAIVDEGLMDNYAMNDAKKKIIIHNIKVENAKTGSATEIADNSSNLMEESKFKQSKQKRGDNVNYTNKNNQMDEDLEKLALTVYNDKEFVDLLYGNSHDEIIDYELLKEKELSLQYNIDNLKIKLNNELRKKYDTELFSRTALNQLPLFLFYERRTVGNQLYFRKRIAKVIYNETHMLYSMLYNFRDNDYNKRRFKRSYFRNIKRMAASLDYSLYKHAKDSLKKNMNKARIDSDILIHTSRSMPFIKYIDGLCEQSGNLSSSNKAGHEGKVFGRFYWRNPHKRYSLIVKKVQNTKYAYSLDNASRSPTVGNKGLIGGGTGTYDNKTYIPSPLALASVYDYSGQYYYYHYHNQNNDKNCVKTDKAGRGNGMDDDLAYMKALELRKSEIMADISLKKEKEKQKKSPKKAKEEEQDCLDTVVNVESQHADKK